MGHVVTRPRQFERNSTVPDNVRSVVRKLCNEKWQHKCMRPAYGLALSTFLLDACCHSFQRSVTLTNQNTAACWCNPGNAASGVAASSLSGNPGWQIASVSAERPARSDMGRRIEVSLLASTGRTQSRLGVELVYSVLEQKCTQLQRDRTPRLIQCPENKTLSKVWSSRALLFFPEKKPGHFELV